MFRFCHKQINNIITMEKNFIYLFELFIKYYNFSDNIICLKLYFNYS